LIPDEGGKRPEELEESIHDSKRPEEAGGGGRRLAVREAKNMEDNDVTASTLAAAGATTASWSWSWSPR